MKNASNDQIKADTAINLDGFGSPLTKIWSGNMYCPLPGTISLVSVDITN